MTHLIRRAFWLLLAMGACAEQKPAPEILSVSPARLPQQLEAEVTIEGRNFFTEIRGALESGAPQIDDGFVVRVADQEANEILSFAPQAVEALMPAGLPEGTQAVSITTPGGQTARLDNAVSVEPVMLFIEDGPAGNGQRIMDRSLQVGMSLSLFATVRFADGSFYRGEPVSWSISGSGGTLSEQSGNSTLFEATDVGVAMITASHPALGDVRLVLTVRRCTSNDDCIDPCHSTATCDGGTCVQPAPDKDSDEDGFIDIVCDGGNDCDDNPDACGSNCFPGNTAADGCDGFDQECDGEIDEDPDVTWYEDTDGDGFGKSDVSQVTCNAPAGFASDGSDCDDDPDSCGAACSPGADETLAAGNCADGQDNDCDQMTDDRDRSCIEPNTPPSVQMLVSPGLGSSATTFEGSVTTSDQEDPASALVVEWDWEGDGTFESSGTDSMHSFAADGRYLATARVRDTGGLETWTTFELVVSGGETIEVTTEIDESDANASPTTPGMTGLSLREALTYAAGLGTAAEIYVPPTFEISVGSPVALTGGPITLTADGAKLRCTGATDGLRVESSDNEIFGLVVENCVVGVRVQGSGNRLVRIQANNNSNVGVQLAASNNTLGPACELTANGIGVQLTRASTIRQSRLWRNTGEGVQVGSQADGSEVWGNVIFANRSGVVLSGARATSIRFNTVEGNVDHGVQLSGGAREVTLQCNILSNNGRHGLQASSSNFSERSNNDFFSNGNGPCTACSPQPSSFQLDPEFIDSANDDFRLSPFSALIDRCPDLGLDVNGAAPNNFNGDSPDIGGWESPYR